MRSLFKFGMVLLHTGLFAQTTCKVWQYTGTDSANRTLANTQRYDGGRVVYEKCTGFIYGPGITGSDGEYIRVYTDTLLTNWSFWSVDGDSMRTELQYDSAGRLIHEVTFRRKYLPPDTGMSGGYVVILVSTDTNDGKWVKSAETDYVYDAQGHKTSSRTFWKPGGEPDGYVWEYDDKGRMSKSQYYSHTILVWENQYEYFKGGYSYTRTWFDEKGKKIRKAGVDIPPFMLPRKHVYKVDAYGRIIEVRTCDARGKQIDRKVLFYTADGKPACEIFYDEKDKQVLTHVYSYE